MDLYGVEDSRNGHFVFLRDYRLYATIKHTVTITLITLKLNYTKSVQRL